MTHRNEAGFTLIEVVVAMAILALVVMSFLGMRTEAIMNASEARNWRLARELAQEIMSELQAGAREVPPTPGRVPSDRYKDFDYEIVVGEDQISRWESNNASQIGFEEETDNAERLAWQRERDELRQARSKNMSLQDYRDAEWKQDLEDQRKQKAPSEDDLEDVVVAVYFPNVRLDSKQKESRFKLKAKISTMALQGLTPEQADVMAKAMGKNGAGNNGNGNNGNGASPNGASPNGTEAPQ